MSKVQIEVKKRDPKIKPKSLVREEIIPGVVYDQKTNSDMIEIPLRILKKFLLDAKQGQLVEITVDGKNPQTAVFKELQMDVRTNSPKHISFMILNEKEKVDMPVRIKLEGESPAVRNSLGVMIQISNSVELRGLPKDFPNYLPIDVTELNDVGDSIGMTAVSVPNGLEFIREEDKELSIVTISPFQKAIEEEKPEVAEGEEGEELAEGEELPEGEEGEAPAEGEEGKESTDEGAETTEKGGKEGKKPKEKKDKEAPEGRKKKKKEPQSSKGKDKK